MSAQGFKWWQNDRYRAELGLTTDQSRRLEEIFQSTAADAARAEEGVRHGRRPSSNRLVEHGNDSAVMEQVLNVEAARAELNKTRTLMLLRMRRASTTDQWVKLGAMHQADERERERKHQHANNELRQVARLHDEPVCSLTARG